MKAKDIKELLPILQGVARLSPTVLEELAGFLEGPSASRLSLRDRRNAALYGWEAAKVLRVQRTALRLYEAFRCLDPDPPHDFWRDFLAFECAMASVRTLDQANHYLQRLVAGSEASADLRMNLEEATAYFLGQRNFSVPQNLANSIYSLFGLEQSALQAVNSLELFSAVGGKALVARGLERGR